MRRVGSLAFQFTGESQEGSDYIREFSRDIRPSLTDFTRNIVRPSADEEDITKQCLP